MRFWCSTAFTPPAELIAIARALDRAGYHGVLTSDHQVYPRNLSSAYPYSPHPDGRPTWDPETPWPDSWVTIGAMAAVTEQIRFSNNVYIAGSRPIVPVAKQVATASVLSGGRVDLGMSVGWMREEFELNGQDFDDRGPRTSEMMAALRELWQPGWREFHGEYYDLPAMTLSPAPAPVPRIFTGGHSAPALRRAAALADGWIGPAYPWDEAAHHVGRLRALLTEAGRADDGFEIILGLYEVPGVDVYRRAGEELGVTGLLCQPWFGTDAYHDAIERFAEEIVAPLAAD